MGIHPNPKNLEDIKIYPRYSVLCPHCEENFIERKDYQHGIHFCEKCGYVTKQVMVIDHHGKHQEHAVDLYPKYNKQYFLEQNKNITRLRETYEKYTCTKKEYRIERDYKHYSDVVASQFKMTKHQREEVLWYIRLAGGVNKYCKNCTYEQIILALSVMVMRADKRRIKLGDYKLFNDEGLNEKKYTRILENVLKLVR